MWKTFYNNFRGRLSGEMALMQACEQNRIERYFTFPNFERSAERCGEELRRAGLSDVEVETFPADGKTSWSGWRAMKAWDVESARLWMTVPHQELLADWDLRPQSLVMYSGPFEAERNLIEWNGETDVDLSQKIPLTRHRINDLFPQMRRLNVCGIVSDFIGTLPGVRDRFDLPDDVRWENSAILEGYGGYWGFMLTPRQGEMLRNLLQQGSVRLRVEIKSRVYNGSFKSATGVIRGAELPDEEILFLTHLYEPGANDNASGVGLGLELARSLNEAIEDGSLPRPRRSIRFLFNWEGYGLYAWVHRHRDRVRHILGGLNIDEIGVDQAGGRSVVHLFMPPAANPSCIGDLLTHLSSKILSPRVRWKAVADRAEIINDTITSDPNIDIVLPCLIQYPSRNYHSSADTLDTLSAEVMEAIGLVSATHLNFLANAGQEEAGYLARLSVGACRQKLHETELRLRAGSWPFGARRTKQWFAEQFLMKAESLAKFGFGTDKVKALKREMAEILRNWFGAYQMLFPKESLRCAGKQLLERASSLVLHRATMGAPKAWGSLVLSGEQEENYWRFLYENNLDLLFHRICYWANGRRSLLEIVDRLEFELDELLGDTAIARTSSGSLISDERSVELDLETILYITDLIVQNGYLKAGN